MKEKDTWLRALERFSTAMLSALSYLPAAGLILVAGALLLSAPLASLIPALQWPPLQLLGSLAYNGMMAVMQNLSLVFCVGIAAFQAKKDKQQAALIALLSYLIFLAAGHAALEQLGLLAAADPQLGLYGTGQTEVLGIQTVDMGVTGGILLGFVTGWVYDRSCEKSFRAAPARLYGGPRWSFLCMAGLSLALGLASCFAWPPIQRAVDGLTGWIAASGEAGLFLYGFLERVLVPTGLHHLVYMPFQFSSLGGSLTVGQTAYSGAYAVSMAEYGLGLPISRNIHWMYTGFAKTFGYWGIGAAFVFCARPGQRRRTASLLLPLLLTASLASITEPIDFLFCFLSPVLWLAHGAIAGLFMVLLDLCGVTGFTSGLLSSALMNLSAGAARTNYPLLYLLAAAEIAVYFVVFSFLIQKLGLRTPGREKEAAPPAPLRPVPAGSPSAQALLAALGGRDNVERVDNCITRLRVWVRDASLLDEPALLALSPDGVRRQGRELQLVMGFAVDRARQSLEALLE